jgi:hypothetical protein
MIIKGIYDFLVWLRITSFWKTILTLSLEELTKSPNEYESKTELHKKNNQKRILKTI